MSLTADNSVECRRIGIDDWRLWRKLRLEALEESPYAFSAKLADWQGAGDTEERWRNRLSTVPFNVVAGLNQSAAGMVSATALESNGTIELISMWVAPAARGRGVGDALVQAVIEWGREQRASRIVLGVTGNNGHAVALYRRHMFADVAPVSTVHSGFACERHMIRDL